MKKSNFRLFITAFLFVSTLLFGCSKPLPNASQIKEDVVGQKFRYTGDFWFGGLDWVIKENDINELEIIERFTNKEKKTDKVIVSIKLISGNTAIKGKVAIYYQLFEQGWKLEKIERATEANFEILSGR